MLRQTSNSVPSVVEWRMDRPCSGRGSTQVLVSGPFRRVSSSDRAPCSTENGRPLRPFREVRLPCLSAPYSYLSFGLSSPACPHVSLVYRLRPGLVSPGTTTRTLRQESVAFGSLRPCRTRFRRTSGGQSPDTLRDSNHVGETRRWWMSQGVGRNRSDERKRMSREGRGCVCEQSRFMGLQ